MSKPWFLCEKKCRLNCRITISTSWVIRNEVAIVVDTAAFLLSFSPFCAFSKAWEKKQRLLWFRTHFQVAACANISLHQIRWSFFPLSSHYLFVCLFPSMYRQFLRASLLTIDFELRKILRTCKMNSNWIHQCYIGMNAWYGIGDCIISSDSKLRVISNSQSIQF